MTMRSVLVLLVALTAVAPRAPAQEPQRGNLVDYLTGLLADREGDLFWSTVRRLEDVGKDAVPALREKLDDTSEKVRLGCAKALLQIGDSRARLAAEEALAELVRSATDAVVRVDAIEIYGAEGDPDDALELLEKELEKSIDPRIVIPIARTLWEIDHVKAARNRLIDLVGSKDVQVRSEAALALAEIGYFEGDVREILRSLKKEPTVLGRRAALLDKVMRLSRQLDRAFSTGDATPGDADLQKLVRIKEERIRELEAALAKAARSGGVATAAGVDALLEEVVRIVQDSYVDASRVDRESLILDAVQGLVQGLDPHSVFMDAIESKEFSQSLDGNYPGIGAQVSKKVGEPLEILRPIYGGPAYRQGMRSGDRVLAIDDTKTIDLDMKGIMQLLEGPKDSEVLLEFTRRGWTESKTITVVRETIEVPSVYHEQLPEGIGYIRLTQFGLKSAAEFESAVDLLVDAGLDGLVIDLRDNPGGRLRVAVQIVDLFVAKSDLPIVTQRGRGGESDHPPYYPTEGARTDRPIVVLINENSASASEIVAGALQDYGRATVVGQRSFGKGSVQNIIPLESRDGAQLKLTVQYYFLPLGRCIQEVQDADGEITEPGGVAPDVAVAQDPLPADDYTQRSDIRNHPALLDWVDARAGALETTIPLGDAGDPSVYGDLAELRAKLGTDASDDTLRSVLRRHARQRIEDRRGRAFAFDLESDRQLQVALLEILSQLKKERVAGSPYAWITPLATSAETSSSE